MTGKTAGASFEVRDNAGIPEHKTANGNKQFNILINNKNY